MSQLSPTRSNEDRVGTPKKSSRIIRDFEPGASTAVPLNVAYRLGKIYDLGLLKGA